MENITIEEVFMGKKKIKLKNGFLLHLMDGEVFKISPTGKIWKIKPPVTVIMKDKKIIGLKDEKLELQDSGISVEEQRI